MLPMKDALHPNYSRTNDSLKTMSDETQRSPWNADGQIRIQVYVDPNFKQRTDHCGNGLGSQEAEQKAN